jgi:hypothetical protein
MLYRGKSHTPTQSLAIEPTRKEKKKKKKKKKKKNSTKYT